jgi:hypothetical protein
MLAYLAHRSVVRKRVVFDPHNRCYVIMVNAWSSVNTLSLRSSMRAYRVVSSDGVQGFQRSEQGVRANKEAACRPECTWHSASELSFISNIFL